jgi:hypothetical protein
VGLGCRVVSCHCWSIMGVESLVNGMWVIALCHTEMVGELTAFQVAVSSTVELVLGALA